MTGCMSPKELVAHQPIFPVAVEPKLDGVRALCLVNASRRNCIITTRNGNTLSSLAHFHEALVALVEGAGMKTALVDCEAVSGSFQSGVGSLRQSQTIDEGADLHVFDLVATHRGEPNDATPDRDRRHRLEQAFATVGATPLTLVRRSFAGSTQVLDHMYNTAVDNGLEGIVAKDLCAAYEPGQSTAWLRRKKFKTADLPITRIIPGRGRCAGMAGAVVVDHDGVSVSVGKGLTDAMRKALWDDPTQFIGKLAEVRYQEVTERGSLRDPRFVCLRDDKDPEEAVAPTEVFRVRVRQQYPDAKNDTARLNALSEATGISLPTLWRWWRQGAPKDTRINLTLDQLFSGLTLGVF